MSALARMPAGVTTGGQFTTGARTEAPVELAGPGGTWGGRRDGEVGELPITALITTASAMTEVLTSGRRSESPDDPVLVRAREDDPARWEVADGHHRLADAIRAGRTTVAVEFDTCFDDEPYEGELYDFAQHLPDVAATCEFCPAAAATQIQAHTSRGPVGEPRYACAEHDGAPTFTSFGGGWTERSPIAPTPPSA
ncbi:hypothetical protein [Cellulosimicrobium sp. Marseille-Q4280]|uniref:hypothetical protein n=1 Tax=Cellulosimicrobium sp. Marseille-Q4280 TaxID=2937992 RepID=UPI0020401F11|nr:hypothetical protein [Cellulosimicrobium sp. Marseille-Q4280]